MGKMNGVKQKTYYVKDNVATAADMFAARSERSTSDVVTEALAAYLRKNIPKDEWRVFGLSKKEKATNGHATGTADTAATDSGSGPSAEAPDRDRKRVRLERRNAKRKA